MQQLSPFQIESVEEISGRGSGASSEFKVCYLRVRVFARCHGDGCVLSRSAVVESAVICDFSPRILTGERGRESRLSDPPVAGCPIGLGIKLHECLKTGLSSNCWLDPASDPQMGARVHGFSFPEFGLWRERKRGEKVGEAERNHHS